nr:hypothetical protein [Paraburkholderia sp. Tr-20389]
MICLLGACVSSTPETSTTVTGSDRDSHGCTSSAGYSWCEYTQRCERPWELAKLKGFALSEEHLAHYCSTGTAE